MVKKEIFEWIINKQKGIELRKGKAKRGDIAVFSMWKGYPQTKDYQERRRQFDRCSQRRQL